MPRMREVALEQRVNKLNAVISEQVERIEELEAELRAAKRTCHVIELDALTQTLSMANGCEWGECSECGGLTPADSAFCVECGAKVVDE